MHDCYNPRFQHHCHPKPPLLFLNQILLFFNKNQILLCHPKPHYILPNCSVTQSPHYFVPNIALSPKAPVIFYQNIAVTQRLHLSEIWWFSDLTSFLNKFQWKPIFSQNFWSNFHLKTSYFKCTGVHELSCAVARDWQRDGLLNVFLLYMVQSQCFIYVIHICILAFEEISLFRAHNWSPHL